MKIGVTMNYIKYWKNYDGVFISIGDNYVKKANFIVEKEDAKKLNAINLNIIYGKIFMHYSIDYFKDNIDDNIYRHTNIYFWDYDEVFEKKSLPPIFKDADEKYFIFLKSVIINSEIVTPWFDQPGLGIRYSAEINDLEIPISQMYQENTIVSVSEVLRTNSINNSCIFLLSDEIDVDENQDFYLDKYKIPKHIAYELGFLKILKLKNN